MRSSPPQNSARSAANTQPPVDGQRADFIRLGVLGDWSHPYLTMDFKTEANIIRALGKIIGNGHLHKGAKPVHWCVDCRSALAEAEVEYYDKTSPSIDVAFEAVDQDAIKAKFGLHGVSGPVSLVIWTTTPWTLPANRAISSLASLSMRWCRLMAVRLSRRKTRSKAY